MTDQKHRHKIPRQLFRQDFGLIVTRKKTSRLKTKSIVWYYFKNFLLFFGVFTTIEIISGGLIFFGNINNPDQRNLIYNQWGIYLSLLQNLGWIIYLSIINYKAGKGYGLRAFSGVWVWVVCYIPFFFYDLLDYRMLDMIISKILITLLTLPFIFVGNYIRKMIIKTFNDKHNKMSHQ